MDTGETNGVSMRFLRENWPIVVAFVMIILSWQAQQSSIQNLESRVGKVEAQYEGALRDIGDIKIQLATANTALIFIKDQISTIKK